MTLLLVEVGHSDSIIVQTGRSNTTTVARYHILREAERLRQQENLFQEKCANASTHPISKNPEIVDPDKTIVNGNVGIDVGGTGILETGIDLRKKENNIFSEPPSLKLTKTIADGLLSSVPSFLHNIITSGTGSININVNITVQKQ